MRLDHLLSKEHFLPVCLRARVRGQYTGVRPVLVAHGWNVDYSVRSSGRGLLVLLVQSVERMIFGRGRAGRAVGCLRVRALLALRVAGPGVLACCGGVAGGWSLFENCTVDASICGQVFKGARWMPWYQEPMKDVGGRDRPRGVVNQALIRGCPNGETRQSSWAVTRA